MALTNLEIFEQLDEVVKGLLWMSESDYPFEVFIWEFGEGISLNNEIVLKITKHSLETTVREIFLPLLLISSSLLLSSLVSQLIWKLYICTRKFST
ncbi:MAG: hypothetical protein F6K48_26320 [Okeania sp. SIO3H1]|uniref:nuclease A inhibitor family protein n=1 Tax=Okeania sp. SIO1I7 TaxID=2607772 RepID=UPI0013CA9FCF|nr:nuclease A inhibitor family protein [Okeania sp. SIO1I7]NEN92227.1 hypothetical protein [Okeania sp. SIO3H1]NET29606.1 hypothetical protein [Okeania sp. SIO1I7]